MSQQYNRKVTLILVEGEKGLDLSEFRVSFKTEQQDRESPATAAIRVYNLSKDTIKRIRGEFSKVVLQAGYEGEEGVIFQGTIKQFGIGRETPTDTYLDILAADGDQAYNYATVNKTLAAGSSPADRVKVATDAMTPMGVTPGYAPSYTGGILPRGKVLFGLARAVLRQETRSQGQSWSINNGRVHILPLSGYLPGEAVVLSSTTGLIGIPEQTIDGIRARCLLNPKIVVGGLVQIANGLINQTVQQNPDGPKIAYNSYAGVQLLADVTNDGFYRVIVAEHEGDNRGRPFYTNIICLALNTDTMKVKTQ